MNQTRLVVLMTEIAQDGPALAPEDAMSTLAEMVERLRGHLDQADCEALLCTGACIWRLMSEPSQNTHQNVNNNRGRP